MSQQSRASENLEKAISRVSSVLAIAIVTLFSINGFYAFWFLLKNGGSLSRDAADWGVYGDFVGGFANPIISIATLFVVALAYIAQRQELATTTEALVSSAAEQKKMTEVSILQGQIHAQSALLNRKIDLRVSLYTEIQRLGSARDGEYSISEEGISLTFNARAAQIKELQERRREVDADIGVVEDRLAELSGRLAAINLNVN